MHDFVAELSMDEDARRVKLDEQAQGFHYSIIKAATTAASKFSGDYIGRETPVPIPNTEVKPVGADGTARVAAWESR